MASMLTKGSKGSGILKWRDLSTGKKTFRPHGRQFRLEKDYNKEFLKETGKEYDWAKHPLSEHPGASGVESKRRDFEHVRMHRNTGNKGISTYSVEKWNVQGRTSTTSRHPTRLVKHGLNDKEGSGKELGYTTHIEKSKHVDYGAYKPSISKISYGKGFTDGQRKSWPKRTIGWSTPAIQVQHEMTRDSRSVRNFGNEKQRKSILAKLDKNGS